MSNVLKFYPHYGETSLCITANCKNSSFWFDDYAQNNRYA